MKALFTKTLVFLCIFMLMPLMFMISGALFILYIKKMKGGENMKRLCLMVTMLFLASFAYAENTGNPDYTGNPGPFRRWLNHTHHYEQSEPDYALGVGLNIGLYKADPEREGAKKAIPDLVTVENKYDFVNENGGSYLVATYNIFDMFKKKAE